ncbi:MAG TPA: D-isomer specific 2-hydroxyacid dehydrogenase family protein [Egibacteraceae bacterium]|nr:D-isomer specific 2-hydroxyacid dehydrogenase family protein [Egibacteraceae bacterium]
MAAPRIAVAPGGARQWVCDAVRAGGAELVEPERAEGIVWTETDRAADLKRLLDDVPGIRWVQLPWAGVEPFARAGVLDDRRLWTCGKGVYARPVAEHALALALAGLRNLKRFATSRSWDEQSGISLVGGKVTIFGGGGICRELLRLLAPFDAEVTVVRRHPDARLDGKGGTPEGTQAPPLRGVQRVFGFGERYEALRDADVVFLALALTAETAGLMGAIEFELMAPHAWLVNVARGEHVVTDELLVALQGDVIGGAALDVTDPEPLPEGHPLWSLPNCLITPHTANTEDMAIPLLSERIAENVRRFGAGEELIGPVDAMLGY